jgi:hypothetical protein
MCCRLINTFSLCSHGRVIPENLRINGTDRVGTGRVMPKAKRSWRGLVGCRTRACACTSDPRDLVVVPVPPPTRHTSFAFVARLVTATFFSLPPLSSRPSPSSLPSSPRSPRLKTCRRHPPLQPTPQVRATAAQATCHLVSCTSCLTPRQSALARVRTLVGYAFDCI